MPARTRFIRELLRCSFALFALACLAACSSPTGTDPHGALTSTTLRDHESAAASVRVELAFVVEDWIPAEEHVILVQVTPGTDPELFAARLGLVLLRVLSDDTIVVANVLDSNALGSDEEVANYEPNQQIALTFGQELTMGFFEGTTFEVSTVQTSAAIASLSLAKLHAVAKGEGIKVGVVDTGVDPEHPLLAGKVKRSAHADALGWLDVANGLDDDGDGLVDEAYGHGTMVAGLVALVAPNTMIHAVRALNSDGVGSLADLLTALDALLLDQVDVVNLSLSLNHFSPLLEARLQKLHNAGTVIIAAAGNQGSTTAYPANSPLVIGVAATSSAHVLAEFSNRGGDCELAAPGVGILSAFPANQLGWGDGTSFASPIVAGLTALLRSVESSETELLESAVRLDPLMHGEISLDAFGFGQGPPPRDARERVTALTP